MLGFNPLSSSPVASPSGKIFRGANPLSFATNLAPATLIKLRWMGGDSISFSKTGFSAKLSYSRRKALPISYQTALSAATKLVSKRRLVAAPIASSSSFTVTIRITRRCVATPLSGSLTMLPAGGRRKLKVSAGPLSFSHSMGPAGFTVTRRLSAEPLSFLVSMVSIAERTVPPEIEATPVVTTTSSVSVFTVL